MRTLFLLLPIAVWLGLIWRGHPTSLEEAIYAGALLIGFPVFGYWILWQLYETKRESECEANAWPPIYLSDRAGWVINKKVLVRFQENGVDMDFLGIIVGITGNIITCQTVDETSQRHFAVNSIEKANPEMSVKARHGSRAISGLDFIAEGAESK